MPAPPPPGLQREAATTGAGGPRGRRPPRVVRASNGGHRERGAARERERPGGARESVSASSCPTPSEASDAASTDVPSTDTAGSKLSSPGPGGNTEEAPRARHRTCADVAPAQVDTLVVKRLAAGLREAELLRLLEERGPAAGKAISAELLKGPDGSFSGTAFVRFESPQAAQAALEVLGARPRLGGRRAQVEPQKSKALLGGRELEALLSQEELSAVRLELERFLGDPALKDAALPSSLSSHQRKYAHSLAEQHGLGHSSRQGASGETYVQVSKARPSPPMKTTNTRGLATESLMAALVGPWGGGLGHGFIPAPPGLVGLRLPPGLALPDDEDSGAPLLPTYAEVGAFYNSGATKEPTL